MLYIWMDACMYLFLLTPWYSVCCSVSECCTTSLLRPRQLLGLSARYHAVLFCANNASKPLTFESFLIHSIHAFLARPLWLLPVTIVIVHLSWLCLWIHTLKMTSPTKMPTTQEDAHVHYLYYTDTIDFLVHLMVSCL